MLNILLVEDDLDLAATLVQYLALENIRCDHANNGLSGLQLAQQHSYDALLLDLNLPRLDGLSVCQRLRNQGNDTPILMLTARDQLADKLDGFNAGTDDFLVKPFELQELVVRVQALARRRSGQAREVLLREYPQTVSRHKLEEAVWGDELPDSNSLKVHMFHLRKAVNSPFPTALLHTVPGHGFVLHESTQEAPDQS